MFIKSFPDEIDLMSFFESEPFYEKKEDLHFAYKFLDNNGLELIFAFCIVSGWVKILINNKYGEIVNYTAENVSRFFIEKDKVGSYLCSEVMGEKMINLLKVRVYPFANFKNEFILIDN